jgi:acetyltransferase-like isoleucine patch superfamily enzyme
VAVGRDCRLLGLERGTFGSEPYLISIGDHVTVTGGVRFVTHDGGVWVLRRKYPDIDVVGRITIHDNVFIGLGAILLPGIEIGPDAIVAAGAVVNKDVPPDSIAAGVPARVVGTIEDYERRVLPRAIHVRSGTPAEKRRAFLEHTTKPGPDSRP